MSFKAPPRQSSPRWGVGAAEACAVLSAMEQHGTDRWPSRCSGREVAQ